MSGKKKAIFYIVLIAIIVFILRGIDALVPLAFPPEADYMKSPPNVTFRHETDEFAYDIRVNSQSLRSPEIPVVSDNTRIVFLGDSLVYGTGVQEEDTFTRRTEGLLRAQGYAVDVINAGYPQQAPGTYPRRFRELTEEIQPDALLLVLYTNDVMDMAQNDAAVQSNDIVSGSFALSALHLLIPHTTEQIVQSWLKAQAMKAANREKVSEQDSNANNTTAPDDPVVRFELDIRNLAAAHNIPESKVNAWIERNRSLIARAGRGDVSQWILLAGLLKSDFYINCLDIPDNRRAMFERLAAVITELKAEADARTIPFGLVYVPSELQFDARKWELGKQLGYEVNPAWLTQTSQLERELQNLAGEINAPFLNLTPVCRAQSAGLVWDYDLHFNERGHAIVAPAIARFVEGIVFAESAKGETE
ncbi:MAG: SGNH/GDSL hydrolase family protein [Leptospiraceae bacterium]|nr:SGNH/GDSL hydrolase family protein [Leptospiraceae bacterium]